MIRMQLLTDFCRRLERKGLVDQTLYHKIHLDGNMWINTAEEWRFEKVIENLVNHGISEKVAWFELEAAVVNSTAISYLQLGRPETIIVHPNDDFPEHEEAKYSMEERLH